MVKAEETASAALQQSIINLSGFKTQMAKVRESIIKRLGSEEALSSCQLEPIPAYVMTPNIVAYKQGENLAKYFTLDTTAMRYIVMKDRKPVAFILYSKPLYSKPLGQIYEYYENYLKAYEQIQHLKLPLLSFLNQIRVEGLSWPSAFGTLGCLKDNYIINSTYDEGEAESINPNGGTNRNTVTREKTYLIMSWIWTLEAHYSSFPYLEQTIKTAIKDIYHIERQKDKKQ